MKTRIVLLIVAAHIVISTSFAGPLTPPKGIRHYESGIAPGFSLANMDGELFALKSTRGKWVFLHFWASWCGPCKEEMPAIQQMSELFDNDNFVIVLINTAEDEDSIFSFLSEIGMDLNSLMDADGLVTEEYKPRGLPTTILIDPGGRMQYQAIGGREWHNPEYINFLNTLIEDH